MATLLLSELWVSEVQRCLGTVRYEGGSYKNITPGHIESINVNTWLTTNSLFYSRRGASVQETHLLVSEKISLKYGDDKFEVAESLINYPDEGQAW